MKRLLSSSGLEIENGDYERSSIIVLRLLLLTLVLFLTFAAPVLADDDEDSGDGEPVISFTSVNDGKTQIDINGENLHDGSDPTVILGRNGEDGIPVDIVLTVESKDGLGKQVIANIPDDPNNPGNPIPDGTYLLTVITDEDKAEFHAVVGAQGPGTVPGSCATGEVLTGFDETGEPVCAILANVIDIDGDNFTPDQNDCNNFNPLINPNATEVCDGIDNDCVGGPDDGFDLNTDINNCGACGNACDSFQFVCNTGSCECQVAGTTDCNGLCADLQSDSNNCGACGQACGTGESCNGSGQCALDPSLCQPNETQCGPFCVDLGTNTNNCGACGNVCQTGQTCTAGVCVSSGCQDGEAQACGSDVGACQAGIRVCSNGVFGACIGETTPTTEVCDLLDNNCDGVVDNGFDLSTDPNNCGACGVSCDANESCNSGVCEATSVCGNGIIEPGEACDGSACCDASCQIAPASTVCRASADSCDVAETCDGASALCPANSFAPIGTSCAQNMACDGNGSCSIGNECTVDAECIDPNVCNGDQFCFRGSCVSAGNPLPDETACDGGGFCTGSICVVPVCGNGVVEFPEICDDGNTSNTDDCTNECRFP